MKSLAAAIALFYFASTMAAAPYGFKGQQQAATLYSNVLQFPNNQVTNMGGINALVETGNSNILSNPSFEHLTANTGWTDNGTATGIGTAVAVISGKKAYGFLPTAQTINLTQSSTLYQAQFADGVQGLAMVRIKSDVALKVCSIQAGTVSTTNCVNTNTDSKWGLYKVPFILGATSNGISISSTGVSVTGSTVIVDDAFVGAQDLTQNITACLDVKCETDFSVTVGSTGTVIAESLDWVTTCTNTLGVVACTFASNLTSSLSTGMTCVGNREGSSGGTVAVIGGSTTTTGFSFTSGSTTSNQTVYYCKKTGADYIAAKSRSNGNTYSSNNADTDWASCGHTAASFTGFGTVTAIETQCKRQGSDLLMKGKVTTGTVTAVEARLALPLWNGTQLVSAGTSKIPSFQILGSSVRSNVGAANNIFAAIQPSSSYFVFTSLASPAGTTSILGSSFGSSETQTMGVLRIPIEGWNNSNIIIGQFNGLQTCTDTLACTDTFSASVSSTGVVSSENIDWISGNCSITSTSIYSCTFKTGIFTVPPVCTFGAGTSEPLVQHSALPSSTGLSALTRSAGGTFTAGNFQVSCQKTGADYIGKTAMAVASDQNLRTPGITKGVEYRARINFASSIIKQEGSWISSVTNNSTGNATINIPAGTFSEYPYCQCVPETSEGDTGFYTCNQVLDTLSTTAVKFRGKNNANTLFNINAVISCKGTSP